MITARAVGVVIAALAGWSCSAQVGDGSSHGARGPSGPTEVAGPGFVIRSPGSEWTLLDRAGAVALDRSALAGAWSDEGAAAVLSRVPASEPSLERAAASIVDKLGLAATVVERNAEATVAGKKARRFDAVGEVEGVSLRFAGLVVDQGASRLQWIAWTAGARSCGDGECLSPILEVLEVSDEGGNTAASANARADSAPEPHGGARAPSEPARAEELLELGADWSLRARRYDDFRWQLSWEYAPGDWIVSPTGDARGREPKDREAPSAATPLFVAIDPSGSWRLAVGATQDAKAAAKPAHLASALSLGTASGGPRSARMLDREAELTTYLPSAGGDRASTLVTVTDAGVLVWLSLTGPRSRASERSDRLAAAMKGLSRSPSLVAVETRIDSYVDHRLGFRLKPPAGWLVADRTPATLADRGRFVRWDQGGRWIGVVALGGLGAPEAASTVATRLDAMVSGSLGPLARTAPTVEETQLAGERGTHTRWSGPLMQVDVVTIAARGTAYALVMVDRGGDAFDHAMQSFGLVP